MELVASIRFGHPIERCFFSRIWKNLQILRATFSIFWVDNPKVWAPYLYWYMVSPATWLKQEIRLRDKSCTTLPNDLDIIFKIDQTDRTCSLWMGTLIFCSKLPVGTKHWENWWFSFTYFTDIAVIHHSSSVADGKTCQTAFLLTMSCSNVVVFCFKKQILCYILDLFLSLIWQLANLFPSFLWF